ncbi:tetratricopeptide repeat protein [Alkalimonas sp. NCh-2]|uniref:tetratricopeptide repeat protein n=1 Tax=Alkalimonas sp. NCh-2 TaxID=3144846 RepID=UPI0031F71147
MSRYYLHIAVLVAIFSPFVYANNAAATLHEAEAYLTVQPARTISLLDNMPAPDKLPLNLAIQRNILLLRAAVPTNDMDRLLQVLDALFEHQQHADFQQELTAITSALGIWLRRNNYLHDAQISLSCSYRHSKTERQRLTLTNSMALVARQLNDIDHAKTLFEEARRMALQSGQMNIAAMTENNLGLLALHEGNLAAAEPHFRAALAQYQAMDHRAGKISAGINLLFYFVLQHDVTNFQRLYPPTSTLTTNFPNEAKQALLLWLHQRYLQLQGHAIDLQTKQQLSDAFEQLEDNHVKILIQRYLAGELGVDVHADPIINNQGFNRPWFNSVVACNWPTLSSEKQQTAGTIGQIGQKNAGLGSTGCR